MNETQVIINLVSADKEDMPDALAALATSTALSVSDIPWEGPISEVRVARVNGEFIINPRRSDLQNADMDIIVGATRDSVTMVEGEANECSESDLIEAIKAGHEAIKIQCDAQLELARLVGEKALVKREVEPLPEDEALRELINDFSSDRILEITRGHLDKNLRKKEFKRIREELSEMIQEKNSEEYLEENKGLIDKYFDNLKKEIVRNYVLKEGVRLDGRKSDEIREIWCEIDCLPSAHGSAIFNRGETQSLTSLTLGTKVDEMLIDTALVYGYNDFILHYNFPPFSVGEVKPMRGPGRREVGHANLAARSLKKVIPEDQPYTLRIVSDILESNGSSSMATVCAGSLALMDSGIKTRSGVAGIAMGLVSDGDHTIILSDILGDEDALGDMDFKISGTQHGICACQMDIKIEGLSYEILKQALEQARQGRLHILNIMNQTISESRPDLKPHAPRVVEMIIDKSFIGAVIGPGGKIIQEIQESTGTVISIDEVDNKGIVNISSPDKESIEKAVNRIKEITFVPSVGEVYVARVRSLVPYGVFVDFNGQSGLLHISEISHSRIDRVEDVLKEGDEIKVKVIGIDKKTGKFRLSRKATIPTPDR